MLTVAILADPGTPAELAEDVAQEMTSARSRRSRRDEPPDVEIVRDPVTAVVHSPGEILDAVAERRENEGWDIAICLTDLPVRSDGDTVAVEVRAGDRVAVLSLPALAGPRHHRRIRRAITHLIDVLAEPDERKRRKRARRLDLRYLIGVRMVPIRRREPDGPDDVSFVTVTAQGRWWLLAGMVAANHPRRLVPYLSKAFATAVGSAAIATVNGVIWQLSAVLEWPRLALLTGVSVAILVAWLIVHRNLWEPFGNTRDDREKASLYNAATVITLTLGVLYCYAALFGIELLMTWFVVDAAVYKKITSHPLDLIGHVTLAWLVASAGALGGAVGVGFESEEAVRQAAYGQREKYRARQRNGKR